MSLLADVELLKKAPLPEVRQTIAEKICQYFNEGVFEDEEQRIACDIIRLLSKDVELRVRRALSENIKNNPNLPHDVALAFAQDEIDVAVPILEFSSVLTDGDLIEIVRSVELVGKLSAVARRKNLSQTVSSTLVRKYKEEVVEVLFSNNSARISDECFFVALEEFRNSRTVLGVLAERGDLSLSVIEKMITYTSGKMKEMLEEKYRLTEKQAQELARDARETATLGLLYDPAEANPLHMAEREMQRKKTEQLVKALHREGRLTQSIVLRSLCEGNLAFFEIAMATLAGVPVSNARTLIRDVNPMALDSLCRRAMMPVSAIEPIQVMTKFALEYEGRWQLGDTAYRQQLMQHIVEKEYDKQIPLMPYVIALITSKLQIKDMVE